MSEWKGKRLGEYEIVDEIGRGAMGIVFRARQEGLNREVAVKVLPSALVLTGDSRERFKREAESVAGLSHPNIVRVYSVGEDLGVNYYAMELLKGRSVEQMIDQDGALEPELAVRIAVQVARAIAYAHSRGVIHRDIKPGNIIYDELSDKAVVTDFGLAKQGGAPTLTASGIVVGTPFYMAPEQALAMNDLVGETTDVYGLGASLYEMLTGRPPFEGDDAQVILRKVLEEEVEPLFKVDAAIERDLNTIVLKAMEKDQDRRFEAMSDLADDLQRYLDGEPIEARPPSRISVLFRRLRRNKLAMGFTLATIIFLLILGAAIPLAFELGGGGSRRFETYMHKAGSAFEEGIGERDRSRLSQAAQHFDEASDYYARALAVNPGDETAAKGRDLALFEFHLASAALKRLDDDFVASRSHLNQAAALGVDVDRVDSETRRTSLMEKNHFLAGIIDQAVQRANRGQFATALEDLENAERTWGETPRLADVKAMILDMERDAGIEAELHEAERWLRQAKYDVALVHIESAKTLQREAMERDPDIRPNPAIERLERSALGIGTLTVDTQEPGLKVTLIRLTEDLRAQESRIDIGRTPIHRDGIMPGSYVLEFVGQGLARTTYPFHLDREEDQVVRAFIPRAGSIPRGMVYVPGGELMRFDIHGVRLSRSVSVEPFFIGRYETTVGEYAEFLDGLDEEQRPQMTPPDFDPEGDQAMPVRGVTWYQAYCCARALGKRLPTREEWEYAARGAHCSLYPWGADFDAELAVHFPDGAPEEVTTRPRGASRFGCLNMAGNVWEWVATTPENLQRGLLKGGSYADQASGVTTISELALDRGSSNPQFGFRMAMSLSSVEALADDYRRFVNRPGAEVDLEAIRIRYGRNTEFRQVDFTVSADDISVQGEILTRFRNSGDNELSILRLNAPPYTEVDDFRFFRGGEQIPCSVVNISLLRGENYVMLSRPVEPGGFFDITVQARIPYAMTRVNDLYFCRLPLRAHGPRMAARVVVPFKFRIESIRPRPVLEDAGPDGRELLFEFPDLRNGDMVHVELVLRSESEDLALGMRDELLAVYNRYIDVLSGLDLAGIDDLFAHGYRGEGHMSSLELRRQILGWRREYGSVEADHDVQSVDVFGDKAFVRYRLALMGVRETGGRTPIQFATPYILTLIREGEGWQIVRNDVFYSGSRSRIENDRFHNEEFDVSFNVPQDWHANIMNTEYTFQMVAKSDSTTSYLYASGIDLTLGLGRDATPEEIWARERRSIDAVMSGLVIDQEGPVEGSVYPAYCVRLRGVIANQNLLQERWYVVREGKLIQFTLVSRSEEDFNRDRRKLPNIVQSVQFE